MCVIRWKRIRPEGTWLDEKELFDLKRSLQTINDIIRFFRPSLEEGEEIKYPALTALAGDIQVFPQLIERSTRYSTNSDE